MNTLNQSITRDVHSYLNDSWKEIYKYFNEFSMDEMAQYFTGAIDGTFVVPKTDYTTLVTIAKDYMLNSDLSDKQSQELYQSLKKLGFFESISHRLYAAHFHYCSWSIYALSSFENSENAAFLEHAYETYFSKLQREPLYSLKLEDKTPLKNRLNSFENFCFDYFETTDFRTMNEVRFEALAADYFTNN